MFLDRQKLLEILYTRLSSKENIHLNRRVTGVESFPGGATVTTADGTRYTGHLVLGADGVHSPVRAEMWKAALEGTGLEEKTGEFSDNPYFSKGPHVQNAVRYFGAVAEIPGLTERTWQTWQWNTGVSLGSHLTSEDWKQETRSMPSSIMPRS